MAQAPTGEALTHQIARLARLELSAQEVATFTPQLDEVLKYVAQLQEVNVTGVEPLTQPIELATPLREDVVVPSPRTASGEPKVLSSAPDTLHGGYKTPPVL
jgi:aspartyl-tRNA(Asn)/glutamyl-tRNA(Gln) amidotransferase subunit C